MPKKVEFEIDDDLTPVAGVAVVQCLSDEGGTAIEVVQYGSLHVYQAMGLLLGALDLSRDQFREDFEDAPRGFEETDGQEDRA